jgi:crotonobetainyl-CoA:carnitine CoA-transferase CaiB-like acyl-CoA transferase
LRDDPRFTSNQARLQNHDVFDEVLAHWTGTRASDEVADAFIPHGVPAERLLAADRMYDVDQLDARGFYEDLQHPLTGRERFPGWPFRITPGPLRQHRTPSPTLGQHNGEVLSALGLSEDEMEKLREQRVIGERLLNT